MPELEVLNIQDVLAQLSITRAKDTLTTCPLSSHVFDHHRCRDTGSIPCCLDHTHQNLHTHSLQEHHVHARLRKFEHRPRIPLACFQSLRTEQWPVDGISNVMMVLKISSLTL